MALVLLAVLAVAIRYPLTDEAGGSWRCSLSGVRRTSDRPVMRARLLRHAHRHFSRQLSAKLRQLQLPLLPALKTVMVIEIASDVCNNVKRHYCDSMNNI
jgi:hypothetical protein